MILFYFGFIYKYNITKVDNNFYGISVYLIKQGYYRGNHKEQAVFDNVVILAMCVNEYIFTLNNFSFLSV